MQAELDELMGNLGDWETNMNDLEASAADAGYDPDFEYMDWSEWEEGDTVGTDYEHPTP